ncbi:MAG: HEAT repeat domain-containing protein [Planctomycetes bacterium]|nr:HEAT repeat domain-containing protein [Planctomycetota bacterium]
MPLTRFCLLALTFALVGGAVFAQQDQKPDFESLWATGSLWQVGDNREKVDEARKAIIDAGAEGRKFALTKLGVTAGLEIRCLNAVFKGWEGDAYDDLVANVGHEDATARRNVAELLIQLDDPRAAEALLAQAAKETELSPRLSQVAALAKWKIEDAVPLIVDISHSETERVRHRATSLLGNYETSAAVSRLIEMLDDSVYYVRDGARDALSAASVGARGLCLEKLKSELQLPSAEQNLQRIRLMLPVVASLGDDAVPGLLRQALKHESGGVRGEAADALVTWKLDAGLPNETLDVDALLKQAIDAEHDPYAKAAIEKARTRLGEADKK